MTSFVYTAAIADLARLIHKQNTENLAWLGLGSGQWAVLRVIHAVPGIRQTALCEKLGRHKSVVSRAVTALIRAGYIVRARPAGTSGPPGLIPTRQDLALKQCQERWSRDTEDRLREAFTPAELAAFKECLQRATHRLAAPPAPTVPPPGRDLWQFVDF